jgi:hypothetical protein
MAKFDTLAGQLQTAQPRTGDLLELIAAKFGAAMPDSVKVVREWRILGGRIKEIDLHLGDVRYRIEASRAPGYTVYRQPVVHGVAVGAAEPVAPNVFVQELLADLGRYAQAQGMSADALEQAMYR